MGLESLTSSTTFLDDLNPSNPATTDVKAQGDDHIRGIKNVLLNTFPNLSAEASMSAEDLNFLKGVAAQTIVNKVIAGASDSQAIALSIGTGLSINLSASSLTGASFEPTTSMVFFQANAPTGWTQDTDNNDKALRVVSGNGGGTGGTHGLSSPPSLNHAHTMQNHTHSGPSHNHQWNYYPGSGSYNYTYNSGGSTVGYHSLGNGAQSNLNCDISAPYTDGLTDQAYTSNASGTTGGPSTANTSSTEPTAFAPQYIDVIVATKD